LTNKNTSDLNNIIPDGLIVFISGVPGMGKTTISYELLKKFSKFRIIEETDLIREVLRGYNDYLKAELGDQINFLFDKIYITDHTKLLTFEEAKYQCKTMEHSFNQIVARQQRKGIATIINGVHVIPEVLKNFAGNNNIIFINLYVTNEREIYQRIFNRDSASYMLEQIPFIFQTNNDLYLSTQKLTFEFDNIFNVNVTELSVENTIKKIMECINQLHNIRKVT
jgi:2-phosphoglycerate kinase